MQCLWSAWTEHSKQQRRNFQREQLPGPTFVSDWAYAMHMLLLLLVEAKWLKKKLINITSQIQFINEVQTVLASRRFTLQNFTRMNFYNVTCTLSLIWHLNVNSSHLKSLLNKNEFVITETNATLLSQFALCSALVTILQKILLFFFTNFMVYTL
jgi:hypothetical protein